MAKRSEPKTPPIVPRKYSGQWIAWNSSGTKILACGRTLDEARQRGIAAGEPDPLLAKVPKANVRSVGIIL